MTKKIDLNSNLFTSFFSFQMSGHVGQDRQAGQASLVGQADQDEDMVLQQEESFNDRDFYTSLLDPSFDSSQDLSSDSKPAYEKKKQEFSSFMQSLSNEQIDMLRNKHNPPPTPAHVNDPLRSLHARGRVGTPNPPSEYSESASGSSAHELQLYNDERFSDAGQQEEVEVLELPQDNRQPPPPPANIRRGTGVFRGKRPATFARGRGPPFKIPFNPAPRAQPMPSPPQPAAQQPNSSIVSVNVIPPPQGGAAPAVQPQNTPFLNNFGSFIQAIPSEHEHRLIPLMLKGIGAFNKERGDEEGYRGKFCHWFNGNGSVPCRNKQGHDDKRKLNFCTDPNGGLHWHICKCCINILHTPFSHKMKSCAIAQLLNSQKIEMF